MLKTNAILEIKKNDRIYQFCLPADSPIGEIFGVLCEMRGFVLSKMETVQELDKPNTPVEKPPKE